MDRRKYTNYHSVKETGDDFEVKILPLREKFPMNKIAIITGATAGIGRATALLLAKNKYDVILTGRREDRLR